MFKEGNTEIIAVASGKGGTGKTLLLACAAYALQRAGHSVLMIDTDVGTDGLSLFLLGPTGRGGAAEFGPASLFSELVSAHASGKALAPLGHPITRTFAESEQGPFKTEPGKESPKNVRLDAILTGKDIHETGIQTLHAEITSEQYVAAVFALFAQLREAAQYDYVLVDTRGGFDYRTTVVCAQADSFFIVTEADYTSLNQHRKLLGEVQRFAAPLDLRPRLRAILVNKAIEGNELSFRSAISGHFGVEFNDTAPIPLDPEAPLAYRTHRIPFLLAPDSNFSLAAASALTMVFRVGVASWAVERKEAWDEFVGSLAKARSRANRKRMVRRLGSLGAALLLVVVALVSLSQAHRDAQAAVLESGRQEREQRERADQAQSQIESLRSKLEQCQEGAQKDLKACSDLATASLEVKLWEVAQERIQAGIQASRIKQKAGESALLEELSRVKTLLTEARRRETELQVELARGGAEPPQLGEAFGKLVGRTLPAMCPVDTGGTTTAQSIKMTPTVALPTNSDSRPADVSPRLRCWYKGLIDGAAARNSLRDNAVLGVYDRWCDQSGGSYEGPDGERVVCECAPVESAYPKK